MGPKSRHRRRRSKDSPCSPTARSSRPSSAVGRAPTSEAGSTAYRPSSGTLPRPTRRRPSRCSETSTSSGGAIPTSRWAPRSRPTDTLILGPRTPCLGRASHFRPTCSTHSNPRGWRRATREQLLARAAATSSRDRYCRAGSRPGSRTGSNGATRGGRRVRCRGPAVRRGRGAACCAPTFSLAAALLLALAVALSAQDQSFVLTTADPTYRAPAFIGNGAFSLVASPLGTTPALSFAAGVYDHAADDVPRIAALPAWNEIDVSDGDVWLNDVAPDTTVLQAYRQTLDMYDGTLRTTYDWVRGAKRTTIEITTFVSRADPHLAVVRLQLVPRYRGRVTLRFPLREWPPHRRLALARLDRYDPHWTQDSVWYPGQMVVTARDSVSLTAQVEGGTTRVAVAQSVASPRRLRNVQRSATGISFDAAPGEPVTFTKLVGVATSRDGSDPLAPARAANRRAAARGYRMLLAEHVAAWHRLWETDVVIQGDPELQRVIQAMLFYLLASVREGTDESIPPMGLSSAGYYGHVFWDADTWMFPPLLVLHPAVARSMVGFRYRALGAARRNAARNGYRVLAATADFWASRATFDSSTGRYGIRHVVSVDEGLIGIGNDTYTNAIARQNLEFAMLASRRLGRAPDSRWSRVAAGLYIPFDSAGHYHPTYEGAPPERRGSVVPLLAYPLGIPMSEQAKRNDLNAAIGLLLKEGSGAMMTTSLYPAIAAELGDRALVRFCSRSCSAGPDCGSARTACDPRSGRCCRRASADSRCGTSRCGDGWSTSWWKAIPRGLRTRRERESKG